MPRNVELKARVADLAAVEARAKLLADQGPFELSQDDTFFTCSTGRLKLRQFRDDHGELIFYRRPDTEGPKLSEYILAPTSAPGELREALSQAYGVSGRVLKQRRLYLIGQTRVHLDQVAGLGDFVELEVVLTDEQPLAEGEQIAERLLRELGMAPSSLIDRAYVDLLREAGDVK